MEEIKVIIHSLESNYIKYGLLRYDMRDYMSSSRWGIIQRNLPLQVLNSLRSIEIFFPKSFRKLLKVQKTILPVSIVHLANTRLLLNKPFDLIDKLSLIDKGNGLFYHPYSHHGGQYKKSDRDYESCAHHMARVCVVLHDYYIIYKNESYLNLARVVCDRLILDHRIIPRRTGSSISYYPSTTDCVINTSAEVMYCFALLSQYDARYHNICEELLKFILSEQDNQGAWRYACNDDITAKASASSTIDLAHFSMNIKSLALSFDYIDKSYNDQLINCLKKAIKFVLNSFYSENGKLLNRLNSNEQATLASYCEYIQALISLQNLSYVDSYDKIVDNTVSEVINVYYERGSVGTYKKFGLVINFNSYRLGSGLLQETLLKYNEYKEKFG